MIKPKNKEKQYSSPTVQVYEVKANSTIMCTSPGGTEQVDEYDGAW